MGEFHAQLSPSKRHRWAVCPGSIREEAKYPEQPSGDAAIDGTRSHWLLEKVIVEGMWKHDIPYTMVGIEYSDNDGKWVLDSSRIDRVNVALRYIRERCEAAGVDPIAEKRVYPDGLVGRADMSGTVDVQIPGKLVYEVIDYKDGMGVVVAERNHQLLQYAVGVLAGLDQDKRPKSFQLTVIQPKLALRGMPAISTWNISTSGLLQEVDRIRAEAEATDAPDAPLVPGDAQCKFCRAKATCPALATKALSEVGMMFNAIEPAVLDVASQAAQKDPSAMDDKELRQILEAAPLLRQLLDAVEKEVHNRLEAGTPVPGFKLVRGNGSRAWALSQDEIVKKLTALGIPKGDVFTKKLLSPAQVEKLTWTKGDEVNKLSDKQIARINEEWVAKKTGALTVVPEGDSRPAVVIDASPMFDAIPVQAEVLPSFLVDDGLPDWLK